MAKPLRPKRGTTAKNDAFVGLASEITIDTDKHSIRVHDGVTAGGHEILPKAKNDLLYQEKGNCVTSVNGQTGAVTVDVGVTSFNGSTGAVTYTAPVTSVNGKTGAVTIDVGTDFTLPTATKDVLGGVKTGSNITNTNGTISITSSNVTNALGYTPLKTAPVTKVNGQTGEVTIDTGVTSFNGSKGAVTYTAPVTSVNGKTGAVTVDVGVTSVNGQTGAVTVESAGDRIPLSGNRGSLAGYNVPETKVSGVTISGESSDDTIVPGAVNVTVNNGTSGQTWTKTVALNSASATVTLGSHWKWIGGNAPTISANSILVLKWIGSFGLANLIAGA